MLTWQQTDQYYRDGHTVQPDFLSPDEVAAFIAEIDRIGDGNTLAHHDDTRMEMEPDQKPDGTLVRRIYEPCQHYEVFRNYAESDALLDEIQQLLGHNLIFHYSKINMKPGRVGSVVEWHQDLAYYPLTNRDSLAALLYLDDTTADNGCLQVIPGVQGEPLLNHTVDGYFQGRVTEPVDESTAVPVEGKAGTIIYMNCMTPHASITNTSDRPRRTLILSYRAADAYPLYCAEMTQSAPEETSYVIRGELADTARFTMTEFPIPRYKKKSKSLYELQEESRAG
ncbi:MAG: mitomycin antibiotic biosynthesis protein [Planctomycetaceae bacterium]|nr:mitomycin antibiotic biosynthesis protein [Planctomycetaceae bacterium]